MPDALSVTSVGQARTALGAAAGQHLAAVSGSHSLAEAVHFGALTLLRLIGTEHGMTPPIKNMADGEVRHSYSTAGNGFPAAVDFFGAFKTAP